MNVRRLVFIDSSSPSFAVCAHCVCVHILSTGGELLKIILNIWTIRTSRLNLSNLNDAVSFRQRRQLRPCVILILNEWDMCKLLFENSRHLMKISPRRVLALTLLCWHSKVINQPFILFRLPCFDARKSSYCWLLVCCVSPSPQIAVFDWAMIK